MEGREQRETFTSVGHRDSPNILRKTNKETERERARALFVYLFFLACGNDRPTYGEI